MRRSCAAAIDRIAARFPYWSATSGDGPRTDGSRLLSLDHCPSEASPPAL